MLLVPIPWAGKVWALPFLTALAPSERACREHGWRHRRLTDWARQLVLQTRRWLPERDFVLVGDSGFAALELLDALARQGIVCITRLRLDAALYEPAAPRLPGTNGRPRTKGARLPNLSGILAGPDTGWQQVMVPGWYGEGERIVELCSATAVWRHAGMPGQVDEADQGLAGSLTIPDALEAFLPQLDRGDADDIHKSFHGGVAWTRPLINHIIQHSELRQAEIGRQFLKMCWNEMAAERRYAETGLDGGNDAEQASALRHDAPTTSTVFQGGQRQVPRLARSRVGCERHASFFANHIRPPNPDKWLLPEQGALLSARQTLDDDHVQVTGIKAIEQTRAETCLEGQLKTWMLFLEYGKYATEFGCCEIFDDAETERTVQRRFGELAPCLISQREHRARVDQSRLADLRQPDAAAMTLQQSTFEPAFETVHLLANGGLREPKYLRGLGETACSSHCLEGP